MVRPMAYNERDPKLAAAAHVLRRATMAAHPDALETIKNADDAVNWVPGRQTAQETFSSTAFLDRWRKLIAEVV